MNKKFNILFREHKGSLENAMKTIKTIKSLDDIWKIVDIEKNGFKRENLEIHHYGYDERIDWDTYIVTCKDYGVLGFTNGSLSPPCPPQPPMNLNLGKLTF